MEKLGIIFEKESIMQNSVLAVKERIKSMYGKEVSCVINRGRNKLVNVNVKIDQIYPSMFVISPLEDVELDRKSFSYSDVMCGDIKFL